MGTLISYFPSESSIRDGFVGVGILEQAPPGVVQGIASGVVGLVGEFPWGPTGSRYEPTSTADLRDTMFGPAGHGHPAWQTLHGKRFGRVFCARVTGSGAAAASVTVEDGATGGANSLVATARSVGAAGNNIQIVIAANASVSTSRDVTVRFTRADGTLYEATYTAVQVSSGAVTDPGDPYVLFAAAASVAGPAHPGTYSLGQAVADPIGASTSGSDGTINAAAYAAALATLGGVASPVSIVLPVGSTSNISTADVNGALYTHAQDNIQQIVLLRTVASETPSAAVSDAATYRAENVGKLYGRVVQRLPDTSGSLVPTLTDGNAFLASILAGTDPWISPGSKAGTAFTGQIIDLEHPALGEQAYATLVEGGVSPWFLSSKNGAMIRGAVSTSLDRMVNRIRARRYKTYIQLSVASFLEDYVDSPLDLTLATRSMGPNCTAQVAAIRQFLAAEQAASRLVAFEIDAFSEMDVAKFALGRWDIVLKVQDVPGAEKIIIRHTQGPSVQIG